MNLHVPYGPICFPCGLALIVLLSGCAALTGNQRPEPPTGAIYGKVIIQGAMASPSDDQTQIDFTKRPFPAGATVVIEGSERSAAVDSAGFFHVPSLAPGTYTLVPHKPGLVGQAVMEVMVQPDSISLVHVLLFNTNRPDFVERRRRWFIRERIRKTDVTRRGSIAGQVHDLPRDWSKCILGVSASVYAGQFWRTEPDTLGFFRLDGVLPATYDVRAIFDCSKGESRLQQSFGGTLSGTVLDVRVEAERTSLVNMETCPSWIPEGCPAQTWEEQYVDE